MLRDSQAGRKEFCLPTTGSSVEQRATKRHGGTMKRLRTPTAARVTFDGSLQQRLRAAGFRNDRGTGFAANLRWIFLPPSMDGVRRPTSPSLRIGEARARRPFVLRLHQPSRVQGRLSRPGAKSGIGGFTEMIAGLPRLQQGKRKQHDGINQETPADQNSANPGKVGRKKFAGLDEVSRPRKKPRPSCKATFLRGPMSA